MKIYPGNIDLLRSVFEIEYGDITLGLRPSGDCPPVPRPQPIFRISRRLAAFHSLLIDLQSFFVGHQRPRKLIQLGQVPAKDQRRSRNRPQSELGPLLVLRQPRLPRFAVAGMRSQPSQRKHIRIRPASRLHIRRPGGQPVKLIQQTERILAFIWLVRKTPRVPMIVGDPPHLRVLCHLSRMLDLRRPRRKAQHNRPASLFDRRRNLPNLGRPVRMVRDAIDLDIVEPPPGVELQHRVVICLPGLIILHAVVALIPRAGVGGVSRVRRVKTRPRDGQVLLHHLPRNPAHDMNAKLQSLRMNPIRQRLESRPSRRRWEPARHRNQNPVPIPEILPLGQVRAKGILHVPSLVDHRIRPAKLLEPCEYGDVGPIVSLVDGQPIGIPAVPSHRRRRR